MRRRHLFSSALIATLCSILLFVNHAPAQSDPLPLWNDGPAKQAILQLVRVTTDRSSPKFVPTEQRIAAFDQDGTTWVEQPLYTQVIFAFDRVKAVVEKDSKLAAAEPFKTVLSGDRTAIGKLTMPDLEKIMAATHTGMAVEQFRVMVQAWLKTATHPRFKRPYTDLAYQPMLEVMELLRANGYKTYFVTGGGQDFVRAYCKEVYGIPVNQVVGSVGDTKFGYAPDGRAILTKIPQVMLINDKAGKPEGINLVIGQRPIVAFGNSDGDQQMLEYTQGGDGARLMLLIHHDDAVREYAYGPESKIGTFSDALMAEAKQRGWIVVSMKDDWNRIFSFDK
jgi:phosphoglycolate phosphatase-like HAD superfamily hydrolase